jgi:two-component system response regulator MprA
MMSAIRERNLETCILVFSPAGTTQDRITALDSGADAYLHKPIVIDELMARIRALLRRARVEKGTPIDAGVPFLFSR